MQVDQLEDRYLCMVEAGGSNPLLYINKGRSMINIEKIIRTIFMIMYISLTIKMWLLVFGLILTAFGTNIISYTIIVFIFAVIIICTIILVCGELN